MNSLAIYQDIKHKNSTLSYNFLKEKYIYLIKSRFTSNNCMVEAEERFSFAFLKLYEKIRAEEISNLTNLHGYFITTCKNNFLMCVSRNKIRYSDSIPDYTYYEKDDQYELQNIKDVATNLIQNLPNKLKTISEKIYLEDKDHKEIAEELGIKYDNVRKYQYKSIQKLKQNVPKHLKNYLEVA